jgi:hypothetical protein
MWDELAHNLRVQGFMLDGWEVRIYAILPFFHHTLMTYNPGFNCHTCLGERELSHTNRPLIHISRTILIQDLWISLWCQLYSNQQPPRCVLFQNFDIGWLIDTYSCMRYLSLSPSLSPPRMRKKDARFDSWMRKTKALPILRIGSESIPKCACKSCEYRARWLLSCIMLHVGTCISHYC